MPCTNAPAVNDALPVAASSEFADDPAEVPIATVAAPPEVTAVVDWIDTFTITAFAGSVTLLAGVIAPTAPPSLAKLYCACPISCGLVPNWVFVAIDSGSQVPGVPPVMQIHANTFDVADGALLKMISPWAKVPSVDSVGYPVPEYHELFPFGDNSLAGSY